MLASIFLNYRIILSVAISLAVGYALLFVSPLLNSYPQLMLAFPLAGAFFLMLVVNPRLTFVVIFLARPLLDVMLNMSKVSLGTQDIGFGAILNLIVIFLAVFLYFYEGGFPRRNPVVNGWVIFLVIMLAAVIYSPYTGRALRLYANYLSFFAMFLAPFLVIKNRNDFIFWLKVFAWSFVGPVIYANIDLALGGSYFKDAGMRIQGSFSHPNVLAFYMCLGITYYFFIIKSRLIAAKGFTRGCMIFLLINMLVLLVATKTRNAWIACLFSFLVYGLIVDRKALVILLMTMPLLLFVPSVKDRVVTVFNGQSSINYEGVNSFEWRMSMWKSSMPMISRKPLFGYGLTSFKEMSPQFSEWGGNMGAHNVYVEVLFEAGAVGLFVLIMLFYRPFMFFWRLMKKAATWHYASLWGVVVSYVLSYVVICFADNLSYYLVFNWYAWFFIGLMMVAKTYIVPVKPASQPAKN